MKKICVLVFAILIYNEGVSQGCSDAGVCSIGGMKGHNKKDEKMAFTLNNQYGVGEQSIQIFNTQLESVFRLNSKLKFQIKIPLIFTKGNLGSNTGLGDISTVFSYTYYNKKDWKLGGSGGFKIGVNSADKKYNQSLPANNTIQLSLPMPYQTSLGTHDLLFGMDARYKSKWLFAIGLQWPLIQFNKNNFDTTIVKLDETAKQYFSSNKLFRRPDLVLRIDKNFELNDHWQINAGILPIYHLGHDRIEDENGVSHAVSGSSGLTLNVGGGLAYALSDKFSITLRYASPLIVRKVRPDGLTRQFVSALELRYAF
jgi:hypothetical protein